MNVLSIKSAKKYGHFQVIHFSMGNKEQSSKAVAVSIFRTVTPYEQLT